VKTLSLILTLILFLLGIWFVVEFTQICYECNPAKDLADEMGSSDIIFSIVSFATAIFSVFLITKKKFIASAILCGIVAGSQFVIVLMMFLKNPL